MKELFPQGPLWPESLPKASGMTVVIHNPEEIFSWMHRHTNAEAEATTTDIRITNLTHFENFYHGIESTMFEGQKIWEIEISDGYIESIGFILMANYSPKHGKHYTMTMHISPSPTTLIDKSIWDIPKNVSHFIEFFKRKGFNAESFDDGDDQENIRISSADFSFVIQVFLGYTTEEAACADLGEETLDTPPDFVIRPKESGTGIEYTDFVIKLQGLQLVTSYMIDALYEYYDKTPKTIVFDISLENTEGSE